MCIYIKRQFMDKADAFTFFAALKHQLYWYEDREFVTFPAY
jgi:hypothetical protein